MLALLESKLANNLESSLRLMTDIGAVLTQLELTLRAAESDQIDALIQQLEQKQIASEHLARERVGLLPDRSDYDSCLSLFSVGYQPAISQTLKAIRSTLATLRRQQERVWVLMTVRAHVVDRTLRILSGGSAESYDASGQMSVSKAKPVLRQHRC